MANGATGVREFGPTAIIDVPPEHLFRRGRTLRYERGGAVYATDGLVGYLKHVVVDESAGDAVALVVQVEETGREILLPLQAVDKTAGSAVYLTGSSRQFADWALRAPAYQRKRASKANLKTLLRERVRYGKDPRRTILQAGRDYLETAAPQPVWNPPVRPPLALVASNDAPAMGGRVAMNEPAAHDERGRVAAGEKYR
jgi:hypothetical protein